MISPRDIANRHFSKSTFGGYRVDEVDQFLNEVADTLSKLISQQDGHDKELSALSDRIEQYRKQEESLSSALIGAQKLGDNIVKEAKNKADLTIRDAGIKSDRMVEGARREREREEKDMQRIKTEISEFKSSILKMYKSHLEIVSALPGVEKEKSLNSNKKVEALKESYPEETISPESPVNPVISEPTPGHFSQISQPNQKEEKKYNQNIVSTEEPEQSQRPMGFVPNLSRNQPERQEQVILRENPINPEYKSQENYSPQLQENYVIKADEDYEKVDAINRSNRFGELRFGDNYQINREDEKKKTNKRKKR